MFSLIETGFGWLALVNEEHVGNIRTLSISNSSIVDQFNKAKATGVHGQIAKSKTFS